MKDHGTLRLEFERRERSDVIRRYFSLDAAFGRDDRFKSLVEGFVNVLDDIIFFSDLLGSDTEAFGQVIHEKSTRRERRRLPTVNEHPKVIPGYEYLFPKHDHHAEWLRNHQMVRSRKSKWTEWRIWPFQRRGETTADEKA